jgi:SAM-dependent methyltransferase
VYSTDLAYIHDAGFGDFAERVSPEIVRILRRHGTCPSAVRAALIVEVGCGSGTLARHLVEAGYDVLGIDISPAMVRLARAKARGARVRVGSLTDVRLPACRAVVAINEVVTYVPATGIGTRVEKPLRDFFARVHDALPPRGLFIFDFIESGARRTYRAKSRAGPDWVIAAHAELDPSGHMLTRRMVTIRKMGRQFRRSQERHRVRIYTRDAVRRALADAGFTARMSRAYGRQRLTAGAVAVVAARRA